MQRREFGKADTGRDILDREERTASEGGPYTVVEKKKQIRHPQKAPFAKCTQGKRVRDDTFFVQRAN